MTSLNKYLGSLVFSTQMQELNDLFDSNKAEARVTLWGTRVITVPGHDGSAHFWGIARKAVQAAKERYEADDSTFYERLAGIDLAKKLSKFMQITDDQIANSSFFTRFLALAKDWFEELFCGSDRGTASYVRGTETDPSALANLWLFRENPFAKEWEKEARIARLFVL